MTITQTDIIGKIRTAIDDIAPAGTADSFGTDVDSELWQAVIHACGELSAELPVNLLDVSIEDSTGTVDTRRGFAYTALPDDYLRFVSLDVEGWAGIVRELMEAGSDAEKMQRSAWSRGTATKPKAMLDQDENGRKVIVWWPGDAEHQSAELAYIAKPEVGEPADDSAGVVAEPAGETAGTESNEETAANSETTITCAIRDEAERLVIYRAASIFMEGMKDGDIAEKFRSLSNNY